MEARSSDHVVARAKTRSEDVEGILRLSYSPIFECVQVWVEDNRVPYWHAVDVESIKVMKKGRLPREPAHWKDGPEGRPAWSVVHDLEEARKAGLLRPIGEQQGGTLQDIINRLDSLVEPLTAAGWSIEQRDRDSSWEYGDSASCDLLRQDKSIEVELYDDGRVIGWVFEEYPDDWDFEPRPVAFEADNESDVLKEYKRLDWIP